MFGRHNAAALTGVTFLTRVKKVTKKTRKGFALNPLRFAELPFAPSVASLSLRQGGAQRCYSAKLRVFALKKREYTTAALRANVFAVFFKPQTRKFHQTKFSSRALADREHSEQVTPPDAACRAPRSGAGLRGVAPTRFLVTSCRAARSNIPHSRRSVAAKFTDKPQFIAQKRQPPRLPFV